MNKIIPFIKSKSKLLKIIGAVQPFIQDNIVRKVVQVDGKGSVEFDIREELKIEGDFERYVNIEAIFEEELTGRSQNGSTQITIHKYKYDMELVKESNDFKAGLPFNVFVKVKYYDGSPLVDKVNPVKIFTSYTWNDENATSTDYFLDQHGMVNIKILIPVNTSYLSIKVGYSNSVCSKYVCKSPFNFRLNIWSLSFIWGSSSKRSRIAISLFRQRLSQTSKEI